VNKKKNRYILKKILPSIIILIAVFSGLIKVNIINTKALSPLGNGNKNYEIVSEQFGDDFSRFIKDNCLLKIYCNEGKEILVKIYNSDFKVKINVAFIDSIRQKFYELLNKAKNI